jgi:hypothetical protein
MQNSQRLPSAFADLEKFVDQWDVPTSHARWIRRSETEFSKIREFYDAMFARAEEATTFVEQYPLHHLPDDVACLFRLLLALTQAAVAVEVHNASRVAHSPLPHSLKIVVGVQPHG